LKWLRIKGYRAFKDLTIKRLGPLEIIVGANGSGKTCLFELLRFVRDGMQGEIHPAIVKGSIPMHIFHMPGEEKFEWRFMFDFAQPYLVKYSGRLMGPLGRFHISSEKVERDYQGKGVQPPDFMRIRGGRGFIRESGQKKTLEQKIARLRPDQLALSTITNPDFDTLYKLREYIRGWKFYSSLKIDNDGVRREAPTEQEPQLREDAANLNAVLLYFMTEHKEIFNQLQEHLRSVIPGFKALTMKPRGVGHVQAFWSEGGVDSELSLADLSDGIIRLICWFVLCLHPKPPTLICIDEPEVGVHPKTIPILAGLLQKASERTQLIVATHSSYFLTQFDIKEIAVMRKEDGAVEFLKPEKSEVIKGMLADFGADEIEALHLSDELELFS